MGRGRPRTGRPPAPRRFERPMPRPVLTPEEERRRAQRERRFADSNSSPSAPVKEWSSKVWKEDAAAVDAGKKEDGGKLLRKAIGLGRATGLSRVPNAELSKSRDLMESRLGNLLEKTGQLEEGGHALVSIDVGVGMTGSTSKVMEVWESILADFRQLTMAVTASPLDDVKNLALQIYEGAADACLLGGNMSFYLACQSRLLSDIYTDSISGYPSDYRRDEFIGYSLLYFGVFSVDNREVATIMRRMSPETWQSPFVTSGMAVLIAYRNRDATRFLSLYSTCNIRQKTILSSSLDAMRATAVRTLVRSYLALEKTVARSRVGCRSDCDFLALLKAERADLMSRNCDNAAEFQFRLR